MCDNCSRSKGQTLKSQGHVTYRQTEHFNSAVDDHMNFKLHGNYRHGVDAGILSRSGGHSAYKMQKKSIKTSPNRRNFERCKL